MRRLDHPAQLQQRHAADRVLVDQLLQGNGDAWNAFVQTYGRIIRSRVADVATSFGRGADSSAIDDAVAEVFAALLNNEAAALRGYAAKSSLATYLAVIATRSATRIFAANRLNNSSKPHESHETADNGVPDPIGEIIRDEDRRQVHALLDQLPEKQGTLIRMFHLESRTYSEISQTLGMPIGSVGPTLRRAEAKLKERIESQQ